MKPDSTVRSLIGLLFIFLLPYLTGCRPTCNLSWQQDLKENRMGITKPDSDGDVLIIGGNENGPSSSGGEAQWTVTTEANQIRKLSLLICTNGARHWGKGIHSLDPNGTVEIYINDVPVHQISCDVQGEYGNYWPKSAPVGASYYETPEIDVSGKNIKGPRVDVKIVAKPGVVLDVKGIKLSVSP